MKTAKNIPEYELLTGGIIEDCDRLLAITSPSQARLTKEAPL
jgi:hypothetical protein